MIDSILHIIINLLMESISMTTYNLSELKLMLTRIVWLEDD